MNEDSILQHANALGQAVVNGDLRKAKGLMADPSLDLMNGIPKDVTSFDVLGIEIKQKAARVRFNWHSTSIDAKMESLWAEHDGRPRVVSIGGIGGRKVPIDKPAPLGPHGPGNGEDD